MKFITTAIDYVNGRPHLGHAYEKILADYLARAWRAQGEKVFFLTGTDEHGLKVQKSAQAANEDTLTFCNQQSAHFQELLQSLDISFSAFARTTQPEHQAYVRAALTQLHDSGLLILKEHKGFFSVRQEQFVTSKDRNPDGTWPEALGEVIEAAEENYFLRLEPFRARLLEHLETHPRWIIPDFRRNEVLQALAEPLEDLCISRPKARLTWGIELPFDDKYVTYVWLDALLNYVSFSQGHWPADLQVIGKDILLPAHASYWPCLLFALGLPLPKQLLVHGFWTNSGLKISKYVAKSLIDPVDLIARYGPDGLRYFVLREMIVGYDSDYQESKIAARYTSDLANDLGNLVQRSLTMIHSYRNGVVPAYDPAKIGEAEKILRDDSILGQLVLANNACQPQEALNIVFALIRAANRYVDGNAPWKLAKDPSPAVQEHLDLVLGHLAETLRRLAIFLAPAIPQTSVRIFEQLGIPPQTRYVDAVFSTQLQGITTAKPTPLFPRVTPPQA